MNSASSPMQFFNGDSSNNMNDLFDDMCDNMSDGHYSPSQRMRTSFPPVNSRGMEYSPKPAMAYLDQPFVSMSNIENVHTNSFATWEDPSDKFGERGTWPSALKPASSEGAVRHQKRFGQLTPPDDRSPKSPEPEDMFVDYGNEVERSTRSSHTKPASESKRRSEADVKGGSKRLDDSEREPRQSKKPRKNRKLPRDCDPVEDPEEAAKREKFLERNRVAASKCRQKKKVWTHDLEDRARELTAQKNHLTSYITTLREELLYLKGECLRHSDCDCVRIRDYMASTLPQYPSHASSQRPSQSMPSGRALRADSYGIESVPGSAVTDEDMQSMLSVSFQGQSPDR